MNACTAPRAALLAGPSPWWAAAADVQSLRAAQVHPQQRARCRSTEPFLLADSCSTSLTCWRYQMAVNVELRAANLKVALQ